MTGSTAAGRLIRRAGPEDAPTIAYLCYLAGRGHVRTSVYDLMIPGPPGPTPDRLGQMTAVLTSECRSWFHYSFYTVMEVDGKAAAALCSFSKVEGRALPLLGTFKRLGWSDSDLEAMGDRLRPFIRAEPRVPQGAWVVENVGCLEGYRRRGLAMDLLEHAVRRGVELGHELQQIAVFIGNRPAINAYLKIGFEVTGVKRDPEFLRVFDCPGMYRMNLRAGGRPEPARPEPAAGCGLELRPVVEEQARGRYP